jgi:hypothetical protein
LIINFEMIAHEIHLSPPFKKCFSFDRSNSVFWDICRMVDDTLSLDAGNAAIANLTLRPEIIWALDAGTVAESNSQLSFAPRAICERTITTVRTENCGGGAELGLSSTSEDGLSTAELRVIMDRVGGSTRSSFAFNLEHRF